MTLLNALKCPPTLVVILECHEDICQERIRSHKIDPQTGIEYDMNLDPPKDEAIKARLVLNAEDDEEVVKKR
jgi:hypothetical protein